MPKPPVLALFDFDGTITRRDTLFDFIRFYRSERVLVQGLVRLAPVLLAFKLGFMPNWAAKQRLLTHFFGREPETKFRERGAVYAKQRLPHILRPSALQKIDELKAQQATIYVVSASAEAWIQPWCASLGLHLIATQLEVQNGKITGKIAGKNCYGPEKARRIQAAVTLGQYEKIYAYGDSRGDREMLQLAHHPHYRFFP